MLCEYGCGQEAKYQFKNRKWCCSKSWNSCIYQKNIKKKLPKKINTNSLCNYGCGQIAKYKFKNGKICCSTNTNNCIEVIRKNIESNNGKKFSQKSKNLLRKLKLGSKLSESSKEKISRSKLGKKRKPFSEEHKQKIRKALSGRFGPNAPNWKGGVSFEPYCEIWTDKDYKENIKKRDGYKCLNPYCTLGTKLVLHHINYNKKDCNPFNLITLCNSCNGKANKDRSWHKSWYKAIIYRRYRCQ